jgi:hypothetical protein
MSIVIGLALFSTVTFPATLTNFDVKADCAVFDRARDLEKTAQRGRPRPASAHPPMKRPSPP